MNLKLRLSKAINLKTTTTNEVIKINLSLVFNYNGEIRGKEE